MCANTQRAALAHNRGSVSIRHTRNAAAAVEQARQALGLTWRYVEEFEAQAERMINETITDAAFERLMGEVFGTSDPESSTRAKNAEAQRVATLRHLWHDAETVSPIRGTAWGAYQVVTEYIDHFGPGEDPRGRGRCPRAAVADDRGPQQGQGADVEAPRADRLRSGLGEGPRCGPSPFVDRGGWVDRGDHGPTHPEGEVTTDRPG